MTEEELRQKVEEHHRPRREELEKKTFANNENYEKYLITVATVFMGIWFTFGKEIIFEKNALDTCYFLISGGFLIITLACALSAILVSNKGMRVEGKWLDGECDAYIKGKKHPNTPNFWSASVPWLNCFSGLFFIAGLISFFIFIIANKNFSGEPHVKISDAHEISLSKPLLNVYQQIEHKPAMEKGSDNKIIEKGVRGAQEN